MTGDRYIHTLDYFIFLLCYFHWHFFTWFTRTFIQLLGIFPREWWLAMTAVYLLQTSVRYRPCPEQSSELEFSWHNHSITITLGQGPVDKGMNHYYDKIMCSKTQSLIINSVHSFQFATKLNLILRLKKNTTDLQLWYFADSQWMMFQKYSLFLDIEEMVQKKLQGNLLFEFAKGKSGKQTDCQNYSL